MAQVAGECTWTVRSKMPTACSFALSGLLSMQTNPGLTPWAVIFRRFAAAGLI